MKTKHLLLSLLALLGSTTLHAYNFERNGIYYNILSEEDRTCEVTFESEGASSYSGWIEIPESVQYYWSDYTVIGIGDYAFFCCQLDGITLPSTITRIGESAFFDCTGISSLSIPWQIEHIGDNAFSDSDLGGSLYISNSISYIGECAFFDTKITELTLETRPTLSYGFCTIGYAAFGCCNNLYYANLNSLMYNMRGNPFGIYYVTPFGPQGCIIVNNCLYDFTTDGINLICCPGGCTAYTSPNSSGYTLRSIGQAAFAGCKGIALVDVPSTVTKIESHAFCFSGGYDDNTYHRVNIPASVKDMEGLTFGWGDENLDIYIYGTRIKSISYGYVGRSYGTVHIPYGTKSSFDIEKVSKSFDIVDDIALDNVTITMSNTVRTFCSDYDLDFSNHPTLKAYIASGFNPMTNKLQLTRVYQVPADEGLYLAGEAGNYEVPYTGTNMVYSNLLKGVTTATTIYPTEGDYTNFILANGSHGVGFYTLSSTGQLAAGKAYLQLPTASVSNVKALNVVFEDDDATAIQDIEGCIKAESIYNLQGQRVNSPKRGLYIINGQKVLIK